MYSQLSNRFVGHTGMRGYRKVKMGDKYYQVHRIVCETFIPNPDNKPYVNHKDCNKSNNCADNLEWVFPKENCEHAVANFLYSNQLPKEIGLMIEDDIEKNPNIKYRDLINKYHYSQRSIEKYLKRVGIYLPKMRNLNDDEIFQVIDEYLQNVLTPDEIAKKHNISKDSIFRYLREKNVKERKRNHLSKDEIEQVVDEYLDGEDSVNEIVRKHNLGNKCSIYRYLRERNINYRRRKRV